MSSQLLQSPTDLRSLDLVRRRLSMHAPLSQAEHALIEDGCHALAPVPPGSPLAAEGDRHFLAGGWACHMRDLGPGQTQVLGFILPGDPIGRPHGAHPPLHRAVALTRVWLLDASYLDQRVRSEPGAYPGLVKALAALDDAEHRRHLDHAVRLGALSAYHSMRHF